MTNSVTPWAEIIFQMIVEAQIPPDTLSRLTGIEVCMLRRKLMGESHFGLLEFERLADALGYDLELIPREPKCPPEPPEYADVENSFLPTHDAHVRKSAMQNEKPASIKSGPHHPNADTAESGSKPEPTISPSIQAANAAEVPQPSSTTSNPTEATSNCSGADQISSLYVSNAIAEPNRPRNTGGGKPKLYPYRDLHYTLKELAELLGLPVATIYWRIRYGLPLDADLKRGRPLKHYLFDGEWRTVAEIQSLTSWGRCKVDNRICGDRVLNDQEHDEQLKPEHPFTARLLFHNGKTQTLAEWSRETGIKDCTIAKRLELGWPISKALTITPDRHHPFLNNIYLRIDGEIVRLVEVAQAHGIKRPTLLKRIRTGWDFYKAALVPLYQYRQSTTGGVSQDFHTQTS